MTDSTALVSWDRTQTPFGETVTESGLDSSPIADMINNVWNGQTGQIVDNCSCN
jgi:hypothetical protein